MDEMTTRGKLKYIERIWIQLNNIAKHEKEAYYTNYLGGEKTLDYMLCEVLNRLNHWHLVPACEDQKIPDNVAHIRWVDNSQRIVLEIIYKNALGTIQRTLSHFPNHWPDMNYHAMIVSGESMPSSVDHLTDTSWFSFKDNIWTFSRILNILTLDRDLTFVMSLSNYLDESRQHIQNPINKNVPLLPPLPVHAAAFSPALREGELAVLEQQLKNTSLLFLWGTAGIGKTELAIQLAEEIAPAKGAYFLRFMVPQNKSEGIMKETILNAGIADISPSSDRNQKYNECMEILRQNYGGTIVVIDGLDIPDMTFDEIQADSTYQDIVSLQRNGLRLIITTRNTISQNGYEVKHLSEQFLLDILKSYSPNEEATESTLQKLLWLVDFNTLAVTHIAETLLMGGESITPSALVHLISNGKLPSYGLPQIVTDQNNSYKSDTITGHLQRLYCLTSVEKSTLCALMCASVLPESGMEKTVFLNALPESARERIPYLLDVQMLYMNSNRICQPQLVRQACLPQFTKEGSHSIAFLNTLWNMINLRQRQITPIIEKAECFSLAAMLEIPQCGQYAMYAARLWTLVGKHEKALHYYDKAVTIIQEQAVHDSKILAECYFEMAETCSTLKRDTDASKCALCGIDILKTLPVEKLDIASAYFLTASYLLKEFRYPEALSNMGSGARIREELLSEKHPDRAESSFLMGEVNFILEKYDEALRHYQDALSLSADSVPFSKALHENARCKVEQTKTRKRQKMLADKIFEQMAYSRDQKCNLQAVDANDEKAEIKL